MQIRVASYLAASDLLQREPGRWDALVILDRDAELNPFVVKQTTRHCVLRFDDIERSTVGKQLVTRDVLAAALRFADESDRLLVTCRAGQSRSVATAYLIACQRLGTTDALGMLDPKRHVPNRHVVEVGASLLSADDAAEAFSSWQRQFSHVRLADYYDAIEGEIDALESAGIVNQISVD